MRNLMILCLLSALGTSALSDSTPAVPLSQQNFRDWTVVSGTDAGKGCFATTSVGLKSPSSGLATVALYRLPQMQDDTVAVMTARVPLGASLSAGIAYLHPNGSEAVGLAWQYCDDQTCLASGGVTAPELARLQKGTRLFLGFTPLPASRSLIVPVSLLGFTASWSALAKCQ